MTEGTGLFKMPVFVVDDDLDSMAWVETLQAALAPTEVRGFRTMAEAEEVMLAEPQEPFLLIMDYDFEKNSAERALKGDSFVAEIRRQHLFGPSLPILMLSGRIDDQGRLGIGQRRSWKAPSAFAEKDMLSTGDGVPEDFQPPFDPEGLPVRVNPRLQYLITLLLGLQDAFEERRAVDAAHAARAEAILRDFEELDDRLD